jgi:O-antigen/teichoic acid export membrane protein
MFGLAALATPFVAVVFGPQWAGLVPVIWWLAPVVAVQSVTAGSSQILLAKGRSDLSYRWGIVYCVVLTAGELTAVRWGLVGVAAAFAIGVLLLTPFGLLLAFHQIEMRLRDYLREMIPHLWITLMMTAAVLSISFWIEASGGAQWLQLVVGTLVGAAVYGLLLLRLRPPALQDAWQTLRQRGSHGN